MKIKKGMTLLFLFAILMASEVSFAQGAWNIRYIPLDSLSADWVGKEIRLDFKKNATDVIAGPIDVFPVRDLLSREDTISLIIGQEAVLFKEQWRIYVDHGVVREQYLEGMGNSKRTLIIKEMVLLSIDEENLVVKVTIHSKDGKQNEESVAIPRSSVKGLLVRL